MAEKKEKELTFEQAMERLEEITGKMESGKLMLDESIAAFEEGSALVKYCREKLDAYSAKIKEITEGDVNE
ncbi:MAG: exodeoxyribonuclease VII small subunit [Clostridia bacterium]|nr:exodeoxyribonuclease VII small subunit [Clostridia bacterium]